MREKRRENYLALAALLVLILALALMLTLLLYKAKNKPKDSARVENTASVLSENAGKEAARVLSWPESKTVTVPVLMYHHIGSLPPDADDMRKGLTVSAENFRAQIKYLIDNGYNVVTMEKMFALVAEDKDISKTVVLTFDDGYKDNFENVFPVLQEYKINATFNIISGYVGQSEFMSRDDVLALSEAGNEIGSHTIDHPDLTTISSAKLQNEVVKSKQDLEAIIGRPVITFCYPAGKFNPEVEKAVSDAGYKMAITTVSGGKFSTGNVFEIPRYRINPTTNLSSILK